MNRFTWQIKIHTCWIFQWLLLTRLILFVNNTVFFFIVRVFIQVLTVHYCHSLLRLSCRWLWLSFGKHKIIQQLIILLHVHCWDSLERFTVTKVRLSGFLFSWRHLELKVRRLIEKNPSISKNRHVTVILMWSHRLDHRLTSHTWAIIKLLIIISYHMHGNWLFIPQTIVSTVPSHQMTGMPLLQFLYNFHLLLNF